jgi:ERCC4-type nuclease
MITIENEKKDISKTIVLKDFPTFEQIAKSSIKQLDNQVGCGEEFYRCIKYFIPLFYENLK